jgi:hypothetical protein
MSFKAEVSNVDEGYSVEPPAEYGTMDEFEEKYGAALDIFDLESLIGSMLF